MMNQRTYVVDKMFIMMLLFIVFILCPFTFAEAGVDSPTDDAVLQPCDTNCGCQDVFIYDAVEGRCRFKELKKTVVIYNNNDVEFLADDEMAKAIYSEGEKLFKSILISAILFIACAFVCVVSACIYCCRISYTDRILKKDVKAVAKKLKRDYNSKKMAPKHAPLPAISESCSVLVEPAGVMVV